VTTQTRPARRPRFGDVVGLGAQHYRIVAAAVAGAARGYIRPVAATDAALDRFLTRQDFTAGLVWEPRRALWTTA
jgi:hypothetical protein